MELNSVKMERSMGFEPTFSTPATFTAFAGRFGYERINLVPQAGFEPRTSFALQANALYVLATCPFLYFLFLAYLQLWKYQIFGNYQGTLSRVFHG